MSFVKEEYTDYFKRAGSFSLPDFQLEFNLSYLCARSIIDAYGQKLHYEDGFLYKYVEETDSEEETTTLDESDDELEDEDDDDLCDLDALLEEIKEEMDGYPKKQAMILDYIKEMPGFCEDDKSFGTYLNIKYPNGTPFVLRFSNEDGCYFTDNGLLRTCISDIYSENGISVAHVDDDISAFVSSSALKYENNEVVSDVSNSDDEDDLNGEIAYFVKMFESIFKKIYKKISYEKMPIEEKLDLNVRYILRDFGRKKSRKKEEMEEIAMDIIERIVSIDVSMDRMKACEYSKRLADEAREAGCFVTCISALERVENEFRIASDAEFLLLKKQIFS